MIVLAWLILFVFVGFVMRGFAGACGDLKTPLWGYHGTLAGFVILYWFTTGVYFTLAWAFKMVGWA